MSFKKFVAHFYSGYMLIILFYASCLKFVENKIWKVKIIIDNKVKNNACNQYFVL